MKAGILFSAVVCSVVCFSSQAKGTDYLINFNAGELPSPKLLEDADMTTSDKYICKTELTTENAPKGKKLLKTTLTKNKSKWGVLRPKKADWSAFDYLKFKVYNPQEYMVKVGFAVREQGRGYGPEGSGPDQDYTSRWDSSVTIKPGWNDCEIDLTMAATNGAKETFDTKKILEWYFAGTGSNDEDNYLFFGDFEFSK
ncbi:MAG: hypothetical protein A2231_02830 [Candidatus Firestonebacteria bacterium RIFOXYA2_FULL_40_8]|nr:MAG: hypothetical protein A2231_02830 [Candidatus Firestonebacteria bacterium RIFOXYA2_FULL_40_8]